MYKVMRKLIEQSRQVHRAARVCPPGSYPAAACLLDKWAVAPVQMDAQNPSTCDSNIHINQSGEEAYYKNYKLYLCETENV